jgi:hypothetical protein
LLAEAAAQAQINSEKRSAALEEADRLKQEEDAMALLLSEKIEKAEASNTEVSSEFDDVPVDTAVSKVENVPKIPQTVEEKYEIQAAAVAKSEQARKNKEAKQAADEEALVLFAEEESWAEAEAARLETLAFKSGSDSGDEITAAPGPHSGKGPPSESLAFAAGSDEYKSGAPQIEDTAEDDNPDTKETKNDASASGSPSRRFVMDRAESADWEALMASAETKATGGGRQSVRIDSVKGNSSAPPPALNDGAIPNTDSRPGAKEEGVILTSSRKDEPSVLGVEEKSGGLDLISLTPAPASASVQQTEKDNDESVYPNASAAEVESRQDTPIANTEYQAESAGEHETSVPQDEGGGKRGDWNNGEEKSPSRSPAGSIPEPSQEVAEEKRMS